MDLQTSLYEEIDNAVGAHGLWKLRLNQAIHNGTSEWSVSGTRADDVCAFGKWLHGLPQSVKGTASWKQIQALHAEFHVEAARVLRLALDGKKSEAQQSITTGSKFADLSARLTAAMMKWKREGI